MEFTDIEQIKNARLKKYERHEYEGIKFHRVPSKPGQPIGGGTYLPDTAGGYNVRIPGEPKQFVDSKKKLIKILSR